MSFDFKTAPLNRQDKTLGRRIDTFTRVMSYTLMLVGIGTVISQLAQISPFLESYPGWTWNPNQIIALLLGVGLFWLGKSRATKGLVCFSLFSRREAMKRLLLVLPFFATIILIILKIRLGDGRSYRMIMDEGGFIEYGTVVAYYLAAGFSLPIGRLFIRLGRKILGWGYYLYSAFFLFVALEEVSWGQRLFGLEPPQFFETYNSQQELTIHNLVWFREHLGEGVIVISLGCLLGIAFWYRSNPQKRLSYHRLNYLVPGWFLSGFFVLPLVIYTILEYTDGFNFFILGDQEFAEFLLSLGFLFLVIVNYFRQALKLEILKLRVDETVDVV